MENLIPLGVTPPDVTEGGWVSWDCNGLHLQGEKARPGDEPRCLGIRAVSLSLLKRREDLLPDHACFSVKIISVSRGRETWKVAALAAELPDFEWSLELPGRVEKPSLDGEYLLSYPLREMVPLPGDKAV